ncbi:MULTISPECIES: ATP-binding protein [unclassified Frankia]|uniref:ATP-binding protein n=1 Tax=unclassified Frankia TaxID=2632575 RepID=UPI002AD49A55|nr:MULTISPECIES: ATP-binding protein [unclassified Frankia]
MATVELRFAALPGHVRTARMIAGAVSRRSGVPDELMDEVKLAVGEACARAVSVNRRFDPQALVIVRIGDDDDVFEVSVSDCGPGGGQISPAHPDGRVSTPALINIDCAQADDEISDELSSVVPTGLGLALIQGLVDDVTIAARPDSAGTVVTMRWPISKTADRSILAI